MFGAVKLTKNADPDKHSYLGYSIGLHSRSLFSVQGCKNVIVFGVDNSSSVDIDNKKKDVLVLGEGLTQGLDDTTITAEAKYSINFSRSQRKVCLSLHFNGRNSFLFVNATKNISIQSKNSEIKPYPLFLANILKFCQLIT